MFKWKWSGFCIKGKIPVWGEEDDVGYGYGYQHVSATPGCPPVERGGFRQFTGLLMYLV